MTNIAQNLIMNGKSVDGALGIGTHSATVNFQQPATSRLNRPLDTNATVASWLGFYLVCLCKKNYKLIIALVFLHIATIKVISMHFGQWL